MRGKHPWFSMLSRWALLAVSGKCSKVQKVPCSLTMWNKHSTTQEVSSYLLLVAQLLRRFLTFSYILYWFLWLKEDFQDRNIQLQISGWINHGNRRTPDLMLFFSENILVIRIIEGNSCNSGVRGDWLPFWNLICPWIAEEFLSTGFVAMADQDKL